MKLQSSHLIQRSLVFTNWELQFRRDVHIKETPSSMRISFQQQQSLLCKFREMQARRAHAFGKIDWRFRLKCARQASDFPESAPFTVFVTAAAVCDGNLQRNTSRLLVFCPFFNENELLIVSVQNCGFHGIARSFLFSYTETFCASVS